MGFGSWVWLECRMRRFGAESKIANPKSRITLAPCRPRGHFQASIAALTIGSVALRRRWTLLAPSFECTPGSFHAFAEFLFNSLIPCELFFKAGRPGRGMIGRLGNNRPGQSLKSGKSCLPLCPVQVRTFCPWKVRWVLPVAPGRSPVGVPGQECHTSFHRR